MRLAIESLIANGVIASAMYTSETASTNSDASEELQSGRLGDQALPRLYLTDRQTFGRGRHGNTWVSDQDALTLSFAMHFDPQHAAGSLLSPAIGVAVAQAIEFALAPCRVSLKWPNDLCTVLVRSPKTLPELYKLGGILIERSASNPLHWVVGIGLNLNRAPELEDVSAAASTPAASLSELASKSVDRAAILTAVAESIMEVLEQLDDQPENLIAEYRKRCVLAGRDLSLRQNEEVVTGFCKGIGDDGSLEMIVGGQPVRFRSGEVRRVRLV